MNITRVFFARDAQTVEVQTKISFILEAGLPVVSSLNQVLRYTRNVQALGAWHIPKEALTTKEMMPTR
jgi:hypothetical protein